MLIASPMLQEDNGTFMLLTRSQSEKSGKGCWKPKELDGERTPSWSKHIASLVQMHVNPLIAHELQACRLGFLRLQPRQRSGSLPTTSGCSRLLTWRGLRVWLPFN